MERGIIGSRVKENVLEKEQIISMDIAKRYMHYSMN